ncbi:MAG: HAMP domain-containing protein [Desulfobacula sp.]|uniref:sensor histidine kinase n=1 Tax=Desulfobacula sp. TaxID=2593537 RepID=UPI001DA9A434|nr:HAMP domain-containing protein [Desulfobacula sp.]MBT3486026.1 HAMP domain-containing protein [Desulfobacula sp.]MBT3804963.1 HAMP domain-containing protein [Desulfobacula sp.]MBT4025451.1 HAMP domain-containing protein [Desulfobacula sp.]MBT4198721.1 HAMP domain-containing protein [Desulfobacula sp.]
MVKKKSACFGCLISDTMPGMKFNLRQKIFLHFLIFTIVNGAIWFFSYYSNSTINQKLIIIEKKKDLLDTVLEARRYEKNFFLRKNKSDLTQALSYIEKTAEKQQIIENEFSGLLEDMTSVRQRTQTIKMYKKNMEDLYNTYDFNALEAGQLKKFKQIQDTVTLIGRTLTTDIEQIERKERERVFDLLERSKKYLLASLLSLFLLTFLTAFFLVKNVNRPLKAIEESIRRIVSGDFNKIPSIQTGDEFESLANSLNDMIEELGKRKNQLVQAEKMSSLGTLTSGVAHELNNPLNNISTSIQIILEEIEEPDIEFKRNLLVEVEQQIDRARDIIRALLEFSRQSEFSVEPVVFNTLVQSTMHLIAGEIPAGIDIQTQIPPDLEGEMDPRRIQQVLLNLIINGVYSMTKGGTMTISAFRDEESAQFIFKVTDTGLGISKKNLAKIFDPFFTTREVGKGSGLGLSIIHGIIEQHHGTIRVESTEGIGTTFTVNLPT